MCDPIVPSDTTRPESTPHATHQASFLEDPISGANDARVGSFFDDDIRLARQNNVKPLPNQKRVFVGGNLVAIVRLLGELPERVLAFEELLCQSIELRVSFAFVVGCEARVLAVAEDVPVATAASKSSSPAR